MALVLILVVLAVAAATGALWSILQIAVGVALGLFLAAVLLGAAAFLLVRHRFRRVQRELRQRLGYD